MATSTRTLDPTQQPAPAPRGRKPANGASTSSNPRVDYIPLPADIKPLGDGEEGFEWLANFSGDQWQNLIAYLWRVSPIHDRKFSGKATAIGKYAKRFDTETVKLDHGSGGYRVDVCYCRPDGNGSKRIGQWYFQIMDLDYPPRLPGGDWLNDPQNSDWKWAEAGIKARDAGAAASPQLVQDPAALFQTVLAGVKQLQGDQPENASLAIAMFDMVTKNQTAMLALNDPARQLETLQSLLTLAKPAEKATDDAKPYMLVIELLRDDLKETREEMRAIRESQSNRKDLFSELLENLPRIKEAAHALGFGSTRPGAATTDWADVIKSSVEKLADHIPGVINHLSRQDPGPRAVQRRKETASETPAARVSPTGEEDSELTAEQQKILDRWGPTIEQAAPFLIDHYRADLGGIEFQRWFTSRFGSLNWGALRDEVGAEALTELAMKNGHLRSVLQPREKLLKFLKDFFSDIVEDDEPAADGAPE
jgi:hypothetical protein